MIKKKYKIAHLKDGFYQLYSRDTLFKIPLNEWTVTYLPFSKLETFIKCIKLFNPKIEV